MVKDSLEAYWWADSSDDKQFKVFQFSGCLVLNYRIWAFGAQNKCGNSALDPLKIGKLWFFCDHENSLTNTLPTSPRPLSDDDFKPRYAPKHVLGPQCPNIVIRAQTPEIGKFWIFVTTRISSPICFQRALNHYQAMVFIRDICPNVEMWKLPPVSPQLHVASSRIRHWFSAMIYNEITSRNRFIVWIFLSMNHESMKFFINEP